MNTNNIKLVKATLAELEVIMNIYKSKLKF